VLGVGLRLICDEDHITDLCLSGRLRPYRAANVELNLAVAQAGPGAASR
jgi:hypothetical protein